MALPDAIEDREFQKFEEVDGKPAVRVTGSMTLTGGSGPFQIPTATKNFTVEKTGNDKIYRFFDVGAVLLKTITLTFEDDSYEELVSGSWA